MNEFEVKHKVIIGISGKLGTGKDYITENIIRPILEKIYLEKHKASLNSKKQWFLTMSFADQIKINVMTKEKVDYWDVYEEKTAESRVLLQTEGALERKSNQNIWINYLDNWMKVQGNRGFNCFIIPDLRFLNEYSYIKNKNSVLIKIIAPKRNNSRLQQESKGDSLILNKISTHRSECDLDILDNSTFDLIIYNDPNELNIEYITTQIEKLLLEKNLF
jgi:hypothetical protein